MKKNLTVFVCVLTMALLIVGTIPIRADTEWGITTEDEYKLELKKFRIFGDDYTAFLSQNLTFYVGFPSINESCYSYEIYNNSNDLIESNVTCFEEIEIEETTYILPNGLPIILPLRIGTISDYLTYLSTLINDTATFIGIDDLLNISLDEIGEEANITVYSTINEEYFNIHGDFSASKLNSTLIEQLSANLGDADLPFSFPDNLTDFTMNVTVTFNAEIGIFDDVNLRIRSIDSFEQPFDIDFKWGRYIPPPPEPTTTTDPTTEPQETVFTWFLPTLLISMLLAIPVWRKKYN